MKGESAVFIVEVSDDKTTARIPATSPGIIRGSGWGLDMPCGGQGSCGKCRVYAQGELSEPDAAEQALLGPLLKQGIRLACRCMIQGGAVIRLPRSPGTEAIASGENRSVPSDGKDGFYFAVDIGTTTLAAELYHGPDGRRAAGAVRSNPQGIFGADVLSRINAALKGHGPELRGLIAGALEEMIREMALEAGAGSEEIRGGAVSGNTAMLHLLWGEDVSPLAAMPFQARRLFGEEAGAGEIGISGFPDTGVYLSPCISAYVGADITAGLLVCGMAEKEETGLLVDIGTNGEMVLCRGGRLTACSTAAGPAFEGAGISMGMRAFQDAVAAVTYQNGGFEIRTIGGGEPRGLCGSGLIDAVAAMLAAGILEDTGRLRLRGHAFEDRMISIGGQDAFLLPGTEVSITQQDIRAVQLAKSAIHAGILALLRENGITAQDVDILYIAGGFGSTLNYQNAAAIGLIPQALSRKTAVLGNAALTGTGLMALNRGYRDRAVRLSSGVETMELSANPAFMDAYIDGMYFPCADCADME